MPVTDWKYPTVATQTSLGGNDWDDPSRVTASNDVRASVTNSGFGGASEYLLLSGFGFTTSDIPLGSTITGIEVEVEGYADQSSKSWQVNVKLGGTGGSSKVDTAPTTEGVVVFGGSTDNWGLSPTEQDARDSAAEVQLDFPSPNATAYVDAVRLRFHWTNDGGDPDPDPLAGLSLTKTITPSNTISSSGGSWSPNDQQVMHAYDGVMAVDVTVPSNNTEGVIFEIGAVGQGAWLGYQTVDGTPSIVWRGGDGGSQTGTPSTGKAEIIVPVAPLQNRSGTLAWEWNMATGGLRLWFDNELLGEATCGAFESGRVAATNDGTFDAVALSVCTGCPTARAGGIDSNLSYYYNQTSSWEPNTYQATKLRRTSRWLGMM